MRIIAIFTDTALFNKVIYTHFYIDKRNGFLVISSFKHLFEV